VTITAVSELTHDALMYGSDEEFASVLTPFLRDGLAAGDGAVAAVTRHNLSLLRDSLGDDARHVVLIDRDDWYQRPASTVAGWVDLLERAQARGQSRIRIVGEVAYGTGARHDTWTRYEAALNDVFASTPAWIVCPYDTRALPEAVISGALRTHPMIATGPQRQASSLYQPPEQLLRTVAEPLPPVPDVPDAATALTGREAMRDARRLVAAIAAGYGWSDDRLGDVVVVVTEIVSNTLRHGGGDPHLTVWATPETLTCEVTDSGPGIGDPLICYRPPSRNPVDSRGLWLAGQLSDWLAYDHRDGRTRVRFSFLA
jgi:anti-sigma regulatory factor (Ser/Thr protein kinase)